MCGICGIYGFSDKELIKVMTETLMHRGPDDEGFFIDDDISLGVRRLSIIDLKKGKQPMFNEDGNICLIFNGEIYNFKELRKNLEKKGHRFLTDCDTEIIVHAYEEYGKDCVNYFDGMFVFAIYTINEKKLFLARDKLGIKPLYFFKNQNFFAFASEIKSLFKVNEIPRKIDYESLLQYSIFGHILGVRSFFENIQQLPPGSYCTISKNNFKIEKYWEPKIKSMNDNMEEEAEILEKNIIDSVKMHLNADVPISVLLSGVDSGLIATISSKFSSKITTITVSDSEDNDDVFYSKIIADTINSNHKIFIVDVATRFNNLPESILHSEDILCFSYNLLAEKSKGESKVVLCGEGADELFMGYPFYENYSNLVKKKVELLNAIGNSKEISFFLNNINNLNDFQENVLKNRLPNHHLIPLDKGSMQHSIEARVPYLSNAIINQSLSITNDLKIGFGLRKAILKKIALKYLPKEAILRKKKGLPDNFNSMYGKFHKICDGLISNSYFNNHPLKRIFRTKYNILKYDLMHKIFIEYNAKIPKNFSITDLY